VNPASGWPEVAGDPRFFAGTGPHSVEAIAAVVGGTVAGSGLATKVSGVAPLAAATPDQLSFLDNRRYGAALEATRAGVVIVHADMLPRVPAASLAIVTPEPYVGWARAAALFHPPPPVRPGVHRSAVIAENAEIDPTAEIGPFVCIGAGATIGPRTRVGVGAVIGAGVVVGAACRIGEQVVVSYALIGARVRIFPGARIGQEGFGFATTATGFLTVPQLGRVILEDDVEIGANTTIDRGSVHDTVIGAGSRLDNLVQIGHNVRLGRGCVIVSQAGISGSTVLEDYVMLGGQAGLTGHLRIGRKARIGAQAGIMSDVPAGADMAGSPAQPLRTFFRELATLRRMARAYDRAGKTDAGTGRSGAGTPDPAAGHTNTD